jgi:tetratricopeptide (TPR) repeat protein
MKNNSPIDSINLKSELNKLLHQGLSHHQNGQILEAASIYEAILKREPQHFDALHMLGVIAIQSNHLELAIDFLNQAIKNNPKSDSAYYNLGICFQNLQQNEAAIAAYQQSVELNPKNYQAYANLGVAQQAMSQYKNAADSYTKSIALNPHNANAYSNRSCVLTKLNHYQDAITDSHMALSIDPLSSEAHYNLGNALYKSAQYLDAIKSYKKAIELNPQYAQAYSNLGLTYFQIGDFKTAKAKYEHALSLTPNSPEIFNNLGLLADAERNFEMAIGYFDQAISIQTSYADAYWNKSHTLLLLGQYSQAWALYEWRWKCDRYLLAKRNFSQPLWQGNETLENKTILLYAEQGLGDTIQFCRYAKLVHTLGAKVILEVPKPLLKLLKDFESVDALIELGQPLPHFDYQCPLMSLPFAFKTDLATIPSYTNYLSADKYKYAYWKNKLKHAAGLKVGVVWNGGFRPNQPEVWGVNERRNIPLDIFSASLNRLRVTFINLQKGEPAESEIREQAQVFWPRGNFINHADELKDFSDTAALIANLDLVISVDTSTAHLAAALGIPTWILNRYDTCWRWLLERNDSPWYPSVRLYRQTQPKNWQEPLERLATDLQELVHKSQL